MKMKEISFTPNAHVAHAISWAGPAVKKPSPNRRRSLCGKETARYHQRKASLSAELQILSAILKYRLFEVTQETYVLLKANKALRLTGYDTTE